MRPSVSPRPPPRSHGAPPHGSARRASPADRHAAPPPFLIFSPMAHASGGRPGRRPGFGTQLSEACAILLSFPPQPGHHWPERHHPQLGCQGLTGEVTQTRIHFGQHHTVGGIVVRLCQDTALAPESVRALTPTCSQEGTVTGTIIPAQVLEVVGQGILAESSRRSSRRFVLVGPMRTSTARRFSPGRSAGAPARSPAPITWGASKAPQSPLSP